MTDLVDIEQRCLFLAEQLMSIKTTDLIGCSDMSVRLVTTALRDVSENFTNYWRKSGFSEKPLIKDYRLRTEILTPDCRAICFGDTEETPSDDVGFGAVKMSAVNELGERVSFGPSMIALPFYCEGNNANIDITRAESSPDILEEMTIGKFFNSPIIYWDGKTLNRLDVIKFVSYGLGFIHSDPQNYFRDNAEQAKILKAINQSHIQFQRQNTLYLLLSIARSISNADCTRKYLAQFNL